MLTTPSIVAAPISPLFDDGLFTVTDESFEDLLSTLVARFCFKLLCPVPLLFFIPFLRVEAVAV